MRARQLPPVVRDVVFLTAGTGLFVWEGLHDARWVPMTLAMVLALGPSFVAAYWSRSSAPTRGNGTPPPPASSSPPQPQPRTPSGAGGAEP